MEWKNYNEKYLISNCGDVKNIKSEKILKIRTTPEGYVHYSLGGTNKKVHRIVANLFVPNPNNLPCVNHIDGNKLNNSYTNLEWCNYSMNLEHAYINKLNSSPNMTVLINKVTGEEHVFISMAKASIFLGFNHGYISGKIKKQGFFENEYYKLEFRD